MSALLAGVLVGCAAVVSPVAAAQPVDFSILTRDAQSLSVNNEGKSIFFQLSDATGNGTVPSLPLHGKWCGPAWPGQNPWTDPVDTLDAICMRHDKCYHYTGYLGCECNHRAARELDTYIPTEKDPRLLFVAVGMRAYMEVPLCAVNP